MFFISFIVLISYLKLSSSSSSGTKVNLKYSKEEDEDGIYFKENHKEEEYLKGRKQKVN